MLTYNSHRFPLGAIVAAFGLLASQDVLAATPTELNAPIIDAIKPDPALKAMLPKKIQESGVIALATDAHYPPCEIFANDNKTMIGYEPDTWNAIAKKLGVKIEPVSIAFDGLLPGVVSKRYDVAMECMSDNVKREEQVIFVNNAYAITAVFTLETNKTITEDPETLCGLTIAIPKGFDVAAMVENKLNPHCKNKGKPAIKMNEYPSSDATLLALYSGRADFVITDYAAIDEMKKSAPKPIRIVANPLLPKLYLGMIVNKDNRQLADALLAALKAIKVEGAYDKIMDNWGLSELKLQEPGINLFSTKPLPEPMP
jgi:polar amino acid transport system substrate-binding protein